MNQAEYWESKGIRRDLKTDGNHKGHQDYSHETDGNRTDIKSSMHMSTYCRFVAKSSVLRVLRKS